MRSAAAVVMPAAVRRAIIRHAEHEQPRECCGLLVGTKARIQFAVPMQNMERGSVRYRIDDRAHIELRRTLRGFQPPLTVCGVYHSHPRGGATPSPTDIAEANYPEWIYAIVGLGSRAVLRAYRITKGRAHELRLRAVSSSVR